MKRRKFTAAFKTKVVLEALKERYTIAELGQKYSIQPNQISIWKKQFLSNASSAFDKGKAKQKESAEQREGELLKIVGQLKVENEFLKKSWNKLK